MTCVIGYKTEDGVYLAADSAFTTSDAGIRYYTTPKIVRKGKLLVGYCGSLRAAQLFSLINFEDSTSDLTIYDIVENYRKVLIDGGSVTTSENGEQETPTQFIIVYNNRLYEILDDFQINEVKFDFTSIGSGSILAFGALEALKKYKMSIEKRLIRALEVCSKFNASVRPPWVIVKY